MFRVISSSDVERLGGGLEKCRIMKAAPTYQPPIRIQRGDREARCRRVYIVTLTPSLAGGTDPHILDLQWYLKSESVSVFTSY